MNIADFKAKLKTCKPSTGNTLITSPVQVNPERTRFKLSAEYKGRWGKHDKYSLIVKFKKPQKHLTVFEDNMLLMVFACGKKPYDYGGFHESPYGKEFIENIESIGTEDAHEILLEILALSKRKLELVKKLKVYAEKGELQ